MRLLSWNVNVPDLQRMEDQVRELANLRPDVLVLQEVVSRQYAGWPTMLDHWRTRLTQVGFRSVHSSVDPCRPPSPTTPAKTCVLVATRRQSLIGDAFYVPWSACVLPVILPTTGDAALEIYGVHLPSGSAYRDAK